MIDFGQIVAQSLSGLAYASTLFLVASGLSLIFGVTRIVNFAHGSFFMLGAYLAYTITSKLPQTPVGFWGGLLLAAALVGALGILMEVFILRRIYRAPELFQILATFGVILVVQNIVQVIWGSGELLAPRAPGLKGAVEILGQRFPEYDVALIFLGPLVLALIWLLLHKTRWGVLVRAATHDREMAASLGVNQGLLFTGVLFVGCFLAGFAGAVQIPKEAANLQMDINIIVETFVIVVIGGMGSILGAFLAAILIGQLHAFGVLAFPSLTLVLIFIVMAVVLIFRPMGLLGRRERPQRVHPEAMERPYAPASAGLTALWTVVLLVMLAVPLVATDYVLVILTEVCVLAIFAASLHFLMSVGGMVSFGHAAYFGLGAYIAALATVKLGVPMLLAMPVAALGAAVAGALFGWFCTRLFGVYLAMLTLAFAQILWSVSIQWVSLTGGDNGILGVKAASWLSSHASFYYFALLIAVSALTYMRRLVFSPFGYALRAGRDSPLRADATGVSVRNHQWFAFVLAGAFAGLAGALIMYQRGQAFPNDLSIAVSVDGLVMVLLGGIQTLTGPVAGALGYHLIQSELVRNFENYWRLILGTAIVLMVLLFPQGIVGALQNLSGRGRKAAA